jgi:superfamily II DNA or RNA helicase/predicted RNA-binding protein YlxR (DUF448 family)
MEIPTDIPRQDQELIRELLNEKPPEFTELKQTQYEAFNQGALSDDNHVLVAHTGNGKTLCAEAVTKKSLKEHKNVAYLVPSRSLVTDKHEEIEGWAPETADVSKGSGYNSADIIVATFESYFEAVVRGYSGRFDTVILDDFHEIYDDSHRGPTIEKGISAALDQNCEIFALSATIGNPEDIASWLDARLTISSEDRAVPIDERPVEKTDASYAKQIHSIISDNPDKGPFIVFCDTTRNVESRALGIADEMSFETPKYIDFENKVKSNISTELTDDHKNLIKALKNGVGYHHSQMDPDLQEEIASLAESGAIKCVTATTSLSYGFNSPVQSVITADLKRYTRQKGRTHIGKYEYIQMIGRAGRDDDVYDQAYAFPMYDGDETPEVFQFETALEQKQIEDVTTHLDGRERLRWLTLELVNYGWDTKEEILDFLSNTLYWEEVSQKYEGIDNINKHVATEVNSSITVELDWLKERGLVSRQETVENDARSGLTNFATTEMGNAVVEYHHSNWFNNTVEDVHTLAKWLRDEIEADSLTPERLVKHLANKYRYCEHSVNAKTVEFIEKANQYSLTDNPGHTAAVMCWYWCHGFSINDIEKITGTNSQTRLPSTAYNLSTAVDSLSELFTADTMPEEPNWLQAFKIHIETGVDGIDTYFINTTDLLGRKRYYNLKSKLNQMQENENTDFGRSAYLIEELHDIFEKTDKQRFIGIISNNTDDIGNKVAQEIYETVSEWDPDEFAPINVPYEHSPRSYNESEYEGSSNPAQGDPLTITEQIQKERTNAGSKADNGDEDGSESSSLKEFL